MVIFLLMVTFTLLPQQGLSKVSEVNLNQIENRVRKNNIKVVLARIDYQLAKAEKLASVSGRDPKLALASFYQKERTPKNSTLDRPLVQETTKSLSLGTNLTFPYGTFLDVSIQSVSIDTNSINAITPKRNQWAGLISVTQPLLKGNCPAYNIDKELKAPHKIDRYKAKLDKTIEKETLKGLRNFWQAYRLDQELTQEKKLLDYYKGLSRYIKKAVKLGSKGAIDKSNAHAKVKRQYAVVLKKKNELMKKFAQLANSIYLPPKNGARKIPQFKFIVGAKALNTNVKTAKTNILNHAELRELAAKMAEDSLSLRKNENSLLPQLDLKVELLTTGLGTKSSAAFNRVKKVDFPSWEFSLSMSWPLGNYASKGSWKAGVSRLNRTRIERLKKLRELNTKQDNLIYSIKASSLSLELMKDRYSIEKKRLKLKRKEFEVGRISFFDLEEAINDFQTIEKDLLKEKIALYNQSEEIRFLQAKDLSETI